MIITNNSVDNQATLDHIIPLSKNGPHAYYNVQTLCRKCNTKKRNNVKGQLIFNFHEFEVKEAIKKYVDEQEKQGYVSITTLIKL